MKRRFIDLTSTHDAGGGKSDLAVLFGLLDPAVAATVAAKTGRSPRRAAPGATALAAFGRAADVVVFVACHAVAAQHGIGAGDAAGAGGAGGAGGACLADGDSGALGGAAHDAGSFGRVITVNTICFDFPRAARLRAKAFVVLSLCAIPSSALGAFHRAADAAVGGTVHLELRLRFCPAREGVVVHNRAVSAALPPAALVALVALAALASAVVSALTSLVLTVDTTPVCRDPEAYKEKPRERHLQREPDHLRSDWDLKKVGC